MLSSPGDMTVILVTSEGSHLIMSPATVQVKVTVSVGHGLPSLTQKDAAVGN